MHHVWRPLSHQSLTPVQAQWLGYAPSMTQRLRDTYENDLSVQVLVHDWQTPRPDDITYLTLLDDAPVIAREVLLICLGQPRLYARTVLPRALVEQRPEDFEGLGERPIGELLFADPAITRSAFECARLQAGDIDFDQAIAATGMREHALWARRSQFHFDRLGAIALTEVFFSQCWQS